MTPEFALATPVLVLALMLAVQFALWWHAKQVANAAAAQAVDVAQVADATAVEGEAAARSFLGQSGNLRNVAVTVDRTADTVTVEVRGDAPRLVPGFAWGVTARSQAEVERYRALGER